jgi:hypothetical protein
MSTHSFTVFVTQFGAVGYSIGTSYFDTQMSGIKFGKGDENLRPVYKKTVL